MAEPNDREMELARLVAGTNIGELERVGISHVLAAYREELLSDQKAVADAFQALAKSLGAATVVVGCDRGHIKVYVRHDGPTALSDAYARYLGMKNWEERRG